jgi:sugar phosphate isomerase/epimerase
MKTLPVGIQLYGLRDLLENNPKNFEGVLQKVKEMGFDGVELAGLYDLSPEYVKTTLAKIGLAPISAHVPLVDMMADAKGVSKIYKGIGCQYMVVPYLPEEYRHMTPGYEKVIAEIKRIGQVMASHGLTLLYHNHDFEFVTLPDGTFGFDDIYNRIPASVLQAEPDTCWIKVAGQNPAAYIEKYKGRCPVIHLKDFIKEGNPKNLYKLIGIETEEAAEGAGIFEFRAVGFGQQIWQPILDAAIKADAKWVIVEQDEHYDLTSLECARRGREYLKILGW